MIALANALKELHCIKLLDIGCNHITDKNAIASVISHNTMLESIDISGNVFQVGGLKEFFMALFQTNMINISNNYNVSGLVDHVVSIIERNTRLETLLLNNCCLNELD